ncbi:MAG TPA: M20/M25/M40 family metallo-hydrolase, partial [bacterium]|nr:M20/M25/M40 family metallo-hydrolase [bacterium]
RDPFQPTLDNDTLYGLGCNDAGGPLVSLIATFLHYYEDESLPFNLVLAATAEEEISGENGILRILDEIDPVHLAMVGEPSGMALTIAERGHLVLEVSEQGQSGHAARDAGENAIYRAIQDIRWFQSYEFPEQSDLLGNVKMTVTMIDGGVQPNVIPDSCRFVVDVRVPDVYTNHQVFSEIQQQITGSVRRLSRDLKSSRLPDGHPLLAAAEEIGLRLTASPTSSDQGLLSIPSVKIGPGQSERSHTADEYIRLSEIEEGIRLFIRLLARLERIT